MAWGQELNQSNSDSSYCSLGKIDLAGSNMLKLNKLSIIKVQEVIYKSISQRKIMNNV